MQGILITAYKDKTQLFNLINSFEDKFYVIVHIDAKTKNISEEDFKKLNLKNIHILKKYKITWGNIKHLYAIIDMLKIAREKKLSYIHIISGQDILIKNVNYLLDKFFDCNNIYMGYNDMSNVDKNVINRYKKGCLSSKLDLTNKIVKIINALYGIISISRKKIGDFQKIYKGMIYVSLPQYAYEYCLEVIEDNPKFMKDLNHCIIPEEFFFQTILMNSKYKDNIVNNHLRYILWHEKNGSVPGILDEENYGDIKKSDCIFARKIDTNISSKLIKLLSEHNN